MRTNSGALLAFAERRDTKDSDLGNFDLVTTRSTDGGCTWSAVRVIGNDAGNRVSNPVPIVDTSTGQVLLFSVVTVRPGTGGSGKGLYLQTSSDDGRTFSPLLARPIRPLGRYRGGLTGPGHGIQLRVTHPGRLLLPMGYRTSAGSFGAYGIYSDDHGVTWRVGFDQEDPSAAVQLIEGTIAELPDGKLFISYRNKKDDFRPGAARRYAISSDGGESLDAGFREFGLPVVSVQGSVLAPTGGQSGPLLFSSPAEKDPTLRRQMTIFVSRTAGATWSRRYQVELEDTPGAYSDLVQVSPDTIGIIYETGTVTWRERIAYEAIELSNLSNAAKVTPTVRYQRSTAPTRVSARARVKVLIAVAGIESPPGRVTLRWTRGTRTGSTAVDLTYSNRGVRVLTLPRLAAGDYRLSIIYSGTGRIRPLTISAGTLRVIND